MHKSKLGGVGVTNRAVLEIVMCTNCDSESMLFVYLGLLVSEKMK